MVATCIILSALCITAAAKSGSGTYNGNTYTVTLTLNRRNMTSRITYPTTIQLGFLGYGESSLGSGYAKVSCANNGMSTSIAKTVVPPNDSLQFYYGYQEYYCNSHYMKTLTDSLTRL